MLEEPTVKRAVCFFDGQNLFNAAKEVWGYKKPNYDPVLLAKAICKDNDWKLGSLWFYTGIPPYKNDRRRGFWVNKLRHLKVCGVNTYSRDTRNGHEKGIDIRIALDVVRMARLNQYDIGVMFCQDQDMTEVADEVRVLAKEQNRWIRLVSAYPDWPGRKYWKGIDKTDWMPFSKEFYDKCIDPDDYWPPPK